MRVKCKKCGEELSTIPERHVMKSCKCGATSVDSEVGYCRLIGAWEFIEED